MVVQLSSVDLPKIKGVKCFGWEVRLLFKDKMVTY